MLFLILIFLVFFMTSCWLAVSMTSSAQKLRETVDRSDDDEARPNQAAMPSLRYIRDPELAAAILLIQAVRSEAPLTTDDKTRIVDLLGGVLHVANPTHLYERAFSYTVRRHKFGAYASELGPLLVDSLPLAQRAEIIGMVREITTQENKPNYTVLTGLERVLMPIMPFKGIAA